MQIVRSYIDNNILTVQIELQYNQKGKSIIKKKIKTNNHSFQSDISLPNLKQSCASKTEDAKLKSALLTTNNSHGHKNVSNGTTINNVVKTKTTIPITIAKSNSKVSVVSKQNTKSISLNNKINTRTTSTSTQTETASKFVYIHHCIKLYI